MKNILISLCCLVCTLFYIIPQVQIMFNITQIGLSMAFILIVLLFINGKKNIPFRDFLGFVPYILIYFIISKPFDLKYGFIHPLLLTWVTVFPVALFSVVKSINSFYVRLCILLSSILLLCYVDFNTILQMEENPVIARAMTSGNTDEDYVISMKLMGVGGYGICYASGLMCIISLDSWFINKGSRGRFIWIPLFLFLSYMVLQSQFTTLLILTFVGCILVIYKNKVFGKNTNKVLLLLLFAGIFALSTIIPLIINFYGDSPVAQHLNELFYGTSEDSQRNQYQKECFILMLENPLWGRDITTSYSFLYTHSHSTLLGCGLATGVVGVYFYIKTLLSLFSKEVSEYGSGNRFSKVLPYMFYYIFLSLLNPSDAMEISFTFFFVVPLILNISDNYELKSKKAVAA